jgi:predicted transposase/invertase (TIGR01784 family)
MAESIAKFLSPTNDVVFKTLFERDRKSLNEMLSTVLGEEVLVEEFLNTEMVGDGPEEKLLRLDLRVRLQGGRRAFVEVQTTLPVYFKERMITYLSREFMSQLRRGRNMGT